MATKRKAITFSYKGVNSHDRNPTIVVLEKEKNSIIGINLFYLNEKERDYVLNTNGTYEKLAKKMPKIARAVRRYSRTPELTRKVRTR